MPTDMRALSSSGGFQCLTKDLTGAVAGARTLVGLSGEKLRIFFVIVLAVLAAQMAMAGFGIGT